jgi:hypothetical protein
MTQTDMNDIYDIIMDTMKIVPKSFDMNGVHFNSDCHMELTEETYETVCTRFGTTQEEGKRIVDIFLGIHV